MHAYKIYCTAIYKPKPFPDYMESMGIVCCVKKKKKRICSTFSIYCPERTLISNGFWLKTASQCITSKNNLLLCNIWYILSSLRQSSACKYV